MARIAATLVALAASSAAAVLGVACGGGSSSPPNEQEASASDAASDDATVGQAADADTTSLVDGSQDDGDGALSLDGTTIGARDGAGQMIEDGGPDVDADAGPYRLCPTTKLPADAGWVVTQGIDVSQYEYVDWDAEAAHAPVYKYAFARASAGADLVDTQFTRSFDAMKRVGLLRGAYHYFHAEEAAAGQVDEYMEALSGAGGLTATDFPPVLDMEDSAGMPNETVACRMKAWLAAVETRTSRVPMIFSLQKYDALFDASFARYSLWTSNWVGDPVATCPRMLTAWPAWNLWQWTSTGNVLGVYVNADSDGAGSIEMSGGKPVLAPTDLDFFNGTSAQLVQFIATTASTSAPPAPAPPSSPPVVLADAGTSCSDGCCVIEH